MGGTIGVTAYNNASRRLMSDLGVRSDKEDLTGENGHPVQPLPKPH